ncbi:right-handed parallel beta-helix repeat-containing protein [Streptomyces sp. NPDC047315]|uniref:right-handed parallel beta-helix repeat-containing protein n=1 Tax=Streptomyces sp. NPDC047315 TaxID=3155142 RepID=UPI0033C4AC8C
MSRLALRVTAAVLGALSLVVGCGGGGGDDDGSDRGRRPEGAQVTIRVPDDAPTITDAVSLARPGDLVLVAPGVYHESVKIDTARVTLRGESRGEVVIDGQLQRPNGVVVTAPGVAVQNLTVQRNTQNGVLVTGSAAAVAGLPGSGGYDTGDEPVRLLESFLVSHVTATRNGLYGIYAFSAQNGVIEHSYASGGADSGIYVGQCKPCRIVVRNNVAELNAVGYENTNASGELYVVGNRLVGNRVGLTVNSDHQEKLLPQRDTVVAGNLIADNQQKLTPVQADGGWGIGIGVDGGSENEFVRNRITGNTNVGFMITATADLTADRNRIAENAFAGNGVDVGWTFPAATRGQGNCLLANALRTTVPAGIADTASCPVPATSPTPSGSWRSPTAPAGIPFTDVAAPVPQPEFPQAATAGATAVPDAPVLPDVAAVVLPSPSLLAPGARVQTS